EPVRLEALRHVLDGEPDGLERSGDWVFSRVWLDELRDGLRGRLEAADELDPGIPAPSGPWAAAVEPPLGLERRGAKLYLPRASAIGSARAARRRSCCSSASTRTG